MNKEIETDLRNSIIVPILIYGRELWALEWVEQFKIQVVEIKKNKSGSSRK